MRLFRLAAAVLSLTPVALADTIFVPDDYETIREALDEAESGDLIEVAPGDYDEFLDFRSDALLRMTSSYKRHLGLAANASHGSREPTTWTKS